jgi:thiamine-phosphate pyrophosphorylase
VRLGIDLPAVYLITPGSATAANFITEKPKIIETIRSASAEGVSLVQVREKQLPARLLFDLARSAADITSRYGTALMVNDRVDVALAAGADGVHLPSNSLPVSVLRKHMPKGFLIAVSAHTPSEVSAARDSGADFVTYAPVFASPGKGEPKGIDDLERVCAAAGVFPVFALGGIDHSNFESVLSAGAAGFAAIRSLNEPDSRSNILSRLKALPPGLR